MRMPQELLTTPLGQMLAPKLSPSEHQLGNVAQQPAGKSGTIASQPVFSTATTAAVAQPVSAAFAAAAPALQVCAIS